MPVHPRLYRRGAVYYHRAAIPVDIADTYPKTEETFSLRTSDHREAVKRVRVAAAEVDRRFDEHRRRLAQAKEPMVEELSDLTIKQIGRMYYAYRLEEDEEVRLRGFGEKPKETIFIPPDMPLEDINALVAGRLERRDTFEERTAVVVEAEEDTRHNYARGKLDSFYMDEALEVLKWNGVDIRLNPNSPSLRKLARELQAAAIKAYKAIQERNTGEVIETPRIALAPIAPAAVPLLSQALKEWIAEKSRTSWVDKTKYEHEVWTAHFLTIAGDKPISAYGKADGRAFKAMLMKLPANWNKFDALRKLPIDQAAERAAELGMPSMSDRNVNKLLGFVGSFWRWAAKNYDECPPNPFLGLDITIKQLARDERDPFTQDELQAMFSSPIFTGCKSLSHWKEPGQLVPRDAGIFWVPLISLFTGARAGEVIQLYVDDVRLEDGVHYLDINRDGEDKRLKNASSRRRIPINETLVAIGLLDHVEVRRKQGERRLFPDLEMGADGYYSSPFSKHFSRFLDSVGIKRRTNAFHSFRHSFEDACRNTGIPDGVMDALQGHSQQGMKGRYGKGYALKVLAEEMGKLRYDGLDLSHLVPPKDSGETS